MEWHRSMLEHNSDRAVAELMGLHPICSYLHASVESASTFPTISVAVALQAALVALRMA